MEWYLPLKLSVTEVGLTAETGLTIQFFFGGIGTSITLHLQTGIITPALDSFRANWFLRYLLFNIWWDLIFSRDDGDGAKCNTLK